jgi:hypothetical protein
VDYVLDIAKEKGLEEIYAIVLPDNARAMDLMKKMGFIFEYLGDGTAKGILNLKNEEFDNVCSTQLKIPEKTGTTQTREPQEQATKKRSKAAASAVSQPQNVPA